MIESDHVKLARRTIEAFVRGEPLPDGAEAPAELREQQAGAFVSLKKNGALRGCIGTIEPTTGSLVQEIIRNAIHAASEDPRFMPVTLDELDELTISVDVLHPAEQVPDGTHLDPKEYGVIVECGLRKGLLLPDLDGVETAEDQVAIACQKGCIALNEPYTLKRFKVDRFT